MENTSSKYISCYSRWKQMISVIHGQLIIFAQVVVADPCSLTRQIPSHALCIPQVPSNMTLCQTLFNAYGLMCITRFLVDGE
jgi:hypothetical protein